MLFFYYSDVVTINKLQVLVPLLFLLQFLVHYTSCFLIPGKKAWNLRPAVGMKFFLPIYRFDILDASSHLYKRISLSVGPLVRPSVDLQPVPLRGRFPVLPGPLERRFSVSRNFIYDKSTL